jgi:hypothetical protein
LPELLVTFLLKRGFFGSDNIRAFESGLPVLTAIGIWLGISILIYKMPKPSSSDREIESQNKGAVKRAPHEH